MPSTNGSTQRQENLFYIFSLITPAESTPEQARKAELSKGSVQLPRARRFLPSHQVSWCKEQFFRVLSLTLTRLLYIRLELLLHQRLCLVKTQCTQFHRKVWSQIESVVDQTLRLSSVHAVFASLANYSKLLSSLANSLARLI